MRTKIEEVVVRLAPYISTFMRDKFVDELMSLLEPENILNKDYSAGRTDGLATLKENPPASWEDTLNKIWSRAHIPEFANDAKTAITGLITRIVQEERQKSAEEALVWFKDLLLEEAANRKGEGRQFGEFIMKIWEGKRNHKTL